jgi:hypothetical protein
MSWRCASGMAALATGLLVGCGTGPIDAVGLVPGTLATDLVAHWTFDDGTGTVVRDSSGKGHDGAINGSTPSWLDQGRFAGALHLEQGDFVAVPNFPNATVGWTVATWVRFASANVGIGEGTVLSTEDVFKGGWELSLTALTDDMHYHFGFWTGPGSYEWTSFNCNGCIEPDRWQHLTAVVDGAALTMSFYLDGALRMRQSIPRPISPGVSTLYMGRWDTTDPPRLLAGALDDAAIWGRPLTSGEIALLTRSPAP